MKLWYNKLKWNTDSAVQNTSSFSITQDPVLYLALLMFSGILLLIYEWLKVQYFLGYLLKNLKIASVVCWLPLLALFVWSKHSHSGTRLVFRIFGAPVIAVWNLYWLFFWVGDGLPSGHDPRWWMRVLIFFVLSANVVLSLGTIKNGAKFHKQVIFYASLYLSYCAFISPSNSTSRIQMILLHLLLTIVISSVASWLLEKWGLL